MQYNGSKVFDFQEKGDVFSNFFNSVIKRDDYVTLYEDCFFSDFDISGHFLGNITLSLPCYRIIFGTVGHTKILWTRRYNIRSVEGMCKLDFHSFWYPVPPNNLMVVFPNIWKVANLVPVLKSDEQKKYWKLQRKIIILRHLKSSSCVFPFFRPKTLSSAGRLCKGKLMCYKSLRSAHDFAKALYEKKQ